MQRLDAGFIIIESSGKTTPPDIAAAERTVPRSAAIYRLFFLYDSAAVLLEIVHYFVELLKHLVGNCRICRGAVVVLARIVGQDMQPILTELIKERRVVVLYILEILEHDILVVVENINKVTKHSKPSAANQQGGIITKEAPLHISNVMLVVDGQATRVGFQMDGDKKVRVAKKTGKVID